MKTVQCGEEVFWLRNSKAETFFIQHFEALKSLNISLSNYFCQALFYGALNETSSVLLVHFWYWVSITEINKRHSLYHPVPLPLQETLSLSTLGQM